MKFASPLLKGLVIFSLLSLTGCNLINEVANNISGGGGSESTSTDQASTIDSLNRYIDLVNMAHDEVDYLESDLVYLEDDVYYYEPGSYDPYFTCTFDYESLDPSLRDDVMSPSGLESSETSDLVGKATAIYSDLDELKSLCTDLAKHITAQDYKEDNFAWVNTTISQMYTLIDSYRTTHNELLDAVDALFDKYDTWEVDLSDPVSVGLDNMDKDLDIADEILTMIEDNYYAGTTEGVGAQLQTSYDELVSAVEAHQDLETDDYVSYYYTDFYSYLDTNFLPTVKRAIRNFDAGDLDAVDTDYTDTLDSYNYLVGDYNYYLDSSGY